MKSKSEKTMIFLGEKHDSYVERLYNITIEEKIQAVFGWNGSPKFRIWHPERRLNNFMTVK